MVVLYGDVRGTGIWSIYGFDGGKDTPSWIWFFVDYICQLISCTVMESIDLELFDRDAVDVDHEGEDVGAQASGYGDDEAAADGEGGCWCRARTTDLRDQSIALRNRWISR